MTRLHVWARMARIRKSRSTDMSKVCVVVKQNMFIFIALNILSDSSFYSIDCINNWTQWCYRIYEFVTPTVLSLYTEQPRIDGQ